MSCCDKNKIGEAENFVDLFTISAQLIAISNSGAAALSLVRYLNIKNPPVLELALKIAELATANAALIRLLKPQPKESAKATSAEIRFGPDSAYSLSVPILTDSDRRAMMQQLSVAISGLQETLANHE